MTMLEGRGINPPYLASDAADERFSRDPRSLRGVNAESCRHRACIAAAKHCGCHYNWSFSLGPAVIRITTKYKRHNMRAPTAMTWDFALSAVARPAGSRSISGVIAVCPNQASTAHQIAEPTIVMMLKVVKFIRTMPAGMEMRWRITGNRRAKKIPPAS